MRLLFFVFFGLLITCSPSRADRESSHSSLPEHPRLLATPADFERIRNAVTQPGPQHDTFELLRETAEREYAEPPYERVLVGRRMLAVSRNALRRIWNNALLYRLTGEKKWAVRAEQEMLSLAAFSDWNPSHFLDTAEAAAAVAIGYDWLYDTLSPESRHTLRDALVRHALQPGDSDQIPWRRNHNNWRQVCETGLALAALSIADEKPKLAWQAIDRAKRNVPLIFDAYEPSGAYLEGPTYWEYGTTYHVLLIEALRTATGSAGALAENPAFLQSASVINILTGPSGGFFNYGDSLYHRPFMPVIYWFARETRQPEIAATEHSRLRHLPHDIKTIRSDNDPFPNRFLALALLWMPAGPPPPAPAPPASWSTQGPDPLAIFRQGTGPKSLYAGMKGGRARLSHAHMDAGSFIFEVGGVRWTDDLGMPSYYEIEKAGVQLFGKDRWAVYALGPHSHSIPLINDLPPDEQATATLRKFSAKDQSATFDLTPLYAGQVKRLERSLRVISPTSILLRDELDGAAPGARYRFSWMTQASVETDATGATLRQHHRTLRLDVSADTPFEIVNEDASHPPASYDAPHPGLRRISVLLTVKNPAHSLEVRATLRESPQENLTTVPERSASDNDLP